MSRIGAIVLAAGLSRRMGKPKLLLSLNEKPLFRYPLELAIRNGLSPICLIGGQHIEIFQMGTADLSGIEYVANPDYEKGMSSSLKMGIEKLKDRTDAALICLADQPFVPDLVIKSIIAESKKGARIVRPHYQGTAGHPILIDKSLYHEFLQLEGDQGGKAITKKYKNDTSILFFEEESWGMDIDTPENYQKCKQYINITMNNI
jgi:molybdenum cofactor cytidylyltransferase